MILREGIGLSWISSFCENGILNSKYEPVEFEEIEGADDDVNKDNREKSDDG